MKARLTLLVGATSSLVLVAFLVPLAVLVRSAAADRAISAAVVEVQSLAPAVASDDGPELRQAVADANAVGEHQMTVFLPGGGLLGPAVPASAAVVQAAAAGQSMTVEVAGGVEVVVAVGGLPQGTAVIRTLVPDEELRAGVARSWLVLGLLGIGLLGLSLLVANLLARSLTRPLVSAATVALRLARGNLGARARDDEGPPEVRQVSAGLNQLAGRITELLAQERATVADLSHRLRTPLTALRIDAESIADSQSRDRLIADLDAVDRTVDSVIREADRPVREGVVVSCDATAVVDERIRFWSALADDEQRAVTVELPRGVLPVRLSAEELSAVVDVLLGNVFAHTPERTPFQVHLSPVTGGGAQLVVSDAGAGFPGAWVAQRGASGRGSTGLGLDIVRRAAERSGGTITIDNAPSGGARITLEIGPPVAAVVRGHRERRLVP